ncbi:DUF1566 domain-containing protein [bacterium]|nr:DUF1566 domain-containing protein [bacterium]
MKRFLILVIVFVSLFAFVSCGGKKKEKPRFEEEITKEIKAEEGGTITNSDESVAIEIPAGALESDTTITMRIYDAADYPGTEDKTVISKVVEFEPTGTIFKKPVFISMISTGTGAELRAAKKKVVTAAVYKEDEGNWSYSKTGATVKVSKDASGDPIMTTAAGDPIMLNAAGDPIMQSNGARLSAAGDPIMITAAGDPIMTSAAGDPIMMTTGHFTAYAFFFIDVEDEDEPFEEPTEEPTEEPEDDKDDTEITDKDEDIEITDEEDDADMSDIETDEDEIPDEIPDETPDEITDEDEEIIIPEPPKVYSKVLCTGMAICTDGEGNQILCPKENEELYGQDAQYASRKGCVVHSYTEIENSEEHEIELKATVQDSSFIKDNVTGLTWWLTGKGGTYEEMKDECAVSYGGIEDWRLPEPQEIASLSDLGMLYGNKIDPVYFAGLYSDTSLPQSKSYDYDLILTSLEGYFYMLDYGVIATFGSESGYLMCVSGEKYGEVSAETYSTVTENGKEMILDSSTNLFWQKEPVKKATWKEALKYCEDSTYAGHNDWRLPNKNELLSLVDYSKIGSEVEETLEEDDEVEAISSFPGMTPDLFWTSTQAPVDYLVWLIHMQYGVVGPSGKVENPEDEPIVGPQQPRRVKNFKRDEIADEEDVPAVLCVRSDLDEKEEFPACNGTGTGPCKDADGTIWSSRIYPEIFADFNKSYLSSYSGFIDQPRSSGSGLSVYIYDIAKMCRYLSENGSNKWRLPKINEIRKNVTTEKLKFEGSCGITTQHFSESYFDEEACSGDGASKTALNDFGIMLSGTLTRYEWDSGEEEEDLNPLFWSLDVSRGVLSVVEDYSLPVEELVQRCVLDETLPDYVTAPYTDPATGLTWSDLAPDEMTWDEAYDYCAELGSEDDTNFWRLPTTEELHTLVRHCEEEPCSIALNGRHSLFGDISFSWSSDINEDGTVNGFDFISVKISPTPKDAVNSSYYVADVRCVSGGESACAGNPCASVENSTGRCLTTTDPEIETGYVCECGEDYYWDDNECVKILTIE